MPKVFACSLVLLAAAASMAQSGKPGGKGPRPEPPALMRRVFEMRDKARFVGVRVVQMLEQGDKRLVTEKIYRDGRKVRIEVLDGPNKGQISVEDEDSRRVWSPQRNEIRELPAREAEFFHRLFRMGGRSGPERKPPGQDKPPKDGPPQFIESEGGRICGVATRLLEAKSQSGRVVNQTWIDPQHGVVLKFQTLEGGGRRNGYLEFTSIKFDSAIPPSTFTIVKPGARVITLDSELRNAAQQLGFRALRVQANGWKLVNVRKMQPGGNKVLMQVYRNQNLQVSLFQMQGKVDGDRLKNLQGGRMTSHVWDQSGFKMVLIGNVPAEGLKRLASTVSG